VVVYAIFHFIGRVTWGKISDFIGRTAALFTVFAIQAVIYFLFCSLRNPVALLIGRSMVGSTFEGMQAIFPVVTADFCGVENPGVNHRVIITAWEVGNVVGPLLAVVVRDVTDGYEIS